MKFLRGLTTFLFIIVQYVQATGKLSYKIGGLNTNFDIEKTQILSTPSMNYIRILSAQLKANGLSWPIKTEDSSNMYTNADGETTDIVLIEGTARYIEAGPANSSTLNEQEHVKFTLEEEKSREDKAATEECAEGEEDEEDEDAIYHAMVVTDGLGQRLGEINLEMPNSDEEEMEFTNQVYKSPDKQSTFNSDKNIYIRMASRDNPKFKF